MYKSGTQAAESIENAALTPAVERVGLTFEPCLFVVGSDGKIKARLDNIYDQTSYGGPWPRSPTEAGLRGPDAPEGRASGPASGATGRRGPAGGSAERLAATAGALGVRVVDGEPGLLQTVLVVQGRTVEQLGARRVDDHLHAAVVGGDVVRSHVAVEEHLVAEARTATGADGDPQRELVVAFSGDELGDLSSRRCR